MVTRRALAYLSPIIKTGFTRTLLRARKSVAVKDEFESYNNTDNIDVSVDLDDTLVEGDGHLHARVCHDYMQLCCPLSHPLPQLRTEGNLSPGQV